MSQEKSERMLAMVGWANRKLEALGLSDSAIVYTDGAARLLSSTGRQLLAVEGDPSFAVFAVVAQVYDGLARLLKG